MTGDIVNREKYRMKLANHSSVERIVAKSHDIQNFNGGKASAEYTKRDTHVVFVGRCGW